MGRQAEGGGEGVVVAENENTIGSHGGGGGSRPQRRSDRLTSYLWATAGGRDEAA